MRTLVTMLLVLSACSSKSARNDDPGAAAAKEVEPAKPGGPVLEGVLPDGKHIAVQKLQPTGPVEPLHDGQWIDLTVGGKRNLAYVYTDPEVGQAAMGGPVSATPTDAEVKALVDSPPETWREPTAFGAHALDAAEIARLHLPARPAWMQDMQ